MDVPEPQETGAPSSPDRATSPAARAGTGSTEVTYVRRDDVVSAELDGETSLFDGTNTALVLNHTASAIWEQLVEPVSLPELVERLTHRFDVPDDVLASGDLVTQVRAVLTDLRSRGLVSPVP